MSLATNTMDYTENEIKLISSFDYGHLLNIEPHFLYKMCVDKAFINNMTGPNVEALLRGYAAMHTGRVYRHTQQFEDLISYD